jgi:hypothetical protein
LQIIPSSSLLARRDRRLSSAVRRFRISVGSRGAADPPATHRCHRICGRYAGRMVEQALLQLMAGRPGGVSPVSMLQWVVTGDSPRPTGRFDVSYPREDLSRRLDI